MLEQGERLGACFRRRLDEWGRARDKCDVLLWDKVQEAAAGRKGEEPSGSGTTRWKQDAKKAADLDSKMCKHIDEIKDEVGPSSSSDAAMLSTDLDEAMGTAFPDEWRTMHKLVSEWQDGKRDGNGEPAKKARLEDVEEDSQLPCGDEEASGIPLTEASVNSMNEAIAKQDEMRRAKRKDIAERDEVLEKRRKGMPPESGKKEEQEVQGRKPQEPKKRILIAGRPIDYEVAADEASMNAYCEQFHIRAKEYAAQKCRGGNPKGQEQEEQEDKELAVDEASMNAYVEEFAARAKEKSWTAFAGARIDTIGAGAWGHVLVPKTEEEVLEKKHKGMPPESGKKEEQEVQGRNPQEQTNRLLTAFEKAKAAAVGAGLGLPKAGVRAEEAKEIAKEVAASDARVNAAAEFARQKKDQARGAAQQAQEMGKAKEAQEMGKAKAAETDKKAAETDKKKYEEKSKRQLRETWPTLQDLFTFL